MVEFTSALCEPTDTSHATCRAPPPIDVRRKMRQLGKMLLLLALTGCVSSDFYQDEPIKPAPSINQSAPPVGSGPQSVPHNVSPAASAAAPTDANESKGELMDCVTESCKINCSPNVKKQFRPKWCARFKEPAVE